MSTFVGGDTCQTPSRKESADPIGSTASDRQYDDHTSSDILTLEEEDQLDWLRAVDKATGATHSLAMCNETITAPNEQEDGLAGGSSVDRSGSPVGGVFDRAVDDAVASDKEPNVAFPPGREDREELEELEERTDEGMYYW